MAKKQEEANVHTSIRAPEMTRMSITIRGMRGSSYVPNQIASRDTSPTKNALGKGKQADKRQDDPTETARECLYINSDGKECIPSSAIQKAIITEAKRGYVEGFNGSYLSGVISVMAQEGFIPIKGKWATDSRHARRPAVRGAPTLVHRPRYDSWEATFDIVYDETLISAPDVIAILNGAGAHIGIGDGRKEKNGPFGGQFEVVG